MGEESMSVLFTPYVMGNMEIPNRFVFSACEDNLADEEGAVTEAVIRKMKRLAQGEVGLIISSHLFVHPDGRTRKRQMGIQRDQLIPGLHRLVETVHQASGKIVFQLGHAGLSTNRATIGRSPLGPDRGMDEDAIWEVVRDFGRAAERSAVAGADGVQLHAAHGYLINQFLSPFFNHREDAWGGSEENRFRFLKEIILEMRKILPQKMAVLVKLNAHDYTPEEGITPPLAASYAKRLAEMAVDGLEVSCGTSTLSPWQMCRGKLPIQEILRHVEEARKAKVEETLNRARDKFILEEGYNLDKTRRMRPVTGAMPLFAVGGWREVSAMEAAVAEGATDFISLCRPLIREPALVRKIREGKTRAASCTSCNRCLMALASDLPGRCYEKGLPG